MKLVSCTWCHRLFRWPNGWKIHATAMRKRGEDHTFAWLMGGW